MILRHARAPLVALLAAILLASCERAPEAVPAAVAPPVGALDLPVDEATFGRSLDVAGWALVPHGTVGVEVRIAGRTLPATTGIARPDVAAARPDLPAAASSGFQLLASLDDLRPQRWPFEVVARNAADKTLLLGKRSLVPDEAMRLWRDYSVPSDARAFHFLMATSGVASGGAAGVESAYRGYATATQRIGIAVPILYLRTTHGRTRDWTFDPSFDTSRKCGERRLVDDSLDEVLQHAVAKRVPVQLILNGGIWADAACDVPDWDVNDHLEADPRNCQWTEDDQVPRDDHLKNLAGSMQSPELGRALTFNVYAREVRRYKKRNLQAAASRVAAFARRHPDLFVGVNLDSDLTTNPFFEQRAWFDYNPGTLRQFREWLRGSGPYAGSRADGVPDLRAFRRAVPLSLAAVNRLANAAWKRWEDVQPPRRFAGSEHQPLKPGERVIWDDPWYREWDTFRKHLVQLHYDELAQWTHEAGIAKERIFAAQGFVAPEGPARPFAVRVTSAGQNYDSGGVSVEGAKPRAGHLGVVLYGPAIGNRVRMEHRHGLFATFARIDAGWAVVESNLADLRRPEKLPTYADAYRAFRDLYNYDARQISLMAWNGSNGIYAGQPDYVSYTSWRNTPAEEAMRDHLVSHAGLPLGSRLWTFGSAQHADDDGWTVENGSLAPEAASVRVKPVQTSVTLLSPGDQVIRASNAHALVIALDAKLVTGIEVWAEREPGSGFARMSDASNPSNAKRTAPGVEVPLRWPADWPADAIAERVSIRLAGVNGEVTVERIALVGAAASPVGVRTAPAR